MSKIFSLTKVLIKEQFSNAFKSSLKSKAKSLSFILLVVAILFGSMGLNFYSRYELLKVASLQNFVLYEGFFNIAVLMLIFFLFQIQYSFFESKDFDFLASLPLKSHQIITAKILSYLVNSYLLQTIILLPVLVFFFLSFKVTLLSLVILLIGFLLLPFLNFFYSTLIAVVTNLVSFFSKRKKLIKQIIIYSFFTLTLVLAVYANAVSREPYYLNNDLPLFLKVLFPTCWWLFQAIVNKNILMFLLFVGVNLALMGVALLLLSKLYFIINKSQKNSNIIKTKEVVYNKQSIFKRLFKLELKTFLTKPIYVINSGFGSIMALVASIAFPIYFIIASNNASAQLIFQNKEIFLSMFYIVFALIFFNCTTSVSISIEGQAFYFKKSLPLKFEMQMLAKLLLNAVLFLPMILLFLTTLPAMIYVKLSFFEILFLLLSMIFIQAFVALLGLMLNLIFPKMDWKNETIVVKQSLSMFLTIMIAMIFYLLVVLGLVYLQSYMSLTLVLLIIILTFLLLSLAIGIFIFTKGKKLFLKI